MFVYAQRFNVLPDKFDAYSEFASSYMSTVMSAPGIDGVEAFLPVSGPHQRVILYRFADPEGWASWRSHEQVRQAFENLRDFVSDRVEELWSPPA